MRIFRHTTHPSAQWALAVVALVIGCCVGIARLQQPDERQISVDALTRAVNKYITAPDTTPRGVRYRWVPSAVPVEIPSPTATGIVRFDTWVWPDTTSATLQLGPHTYTIAPAVAAQPRRYQLLQPWSPWQTIQTLVVTTTGPKPFWAFAGAELRPFGDTPAPSLLLLFFAVAVTLTALGRCWGIPVGWAMVGSQCILGIWMLQSTPVARYLPDTAARADLSTLLTGIGLTIAIIAAAPRARGWYRAATPAQRITTLGFAVACVAPVVATLYGPEPLSERVTENRRLTAFPTALPQNMTEVAAAAVQTEQWLSDHYGWRSLLIRAKNELDYRVFGTSSRVYFGSDDVIYMRRWTDERLPALDAVLHDPSRRAALTERIRARIAFYRAQGIRPIMVVAPSKELIYPEYLPWYVPRYDSTALRAYIAELNAQGIEVIDGEQLLLAAKPTQPMLFHKQDFHWNRVAAHLVADEVLSRVSTTIPPVRPFRQTVTVVSAPSPFADRDFAALWFDRYDVPAGYDIELPLPAGGEWQHGSALGVAMDSWENPTAPVAYPNQNLHIVGDSFSVRFIGAGFEYGFPAVYRSFYPADAAAYPAWLREHNIGVVLWQLRDGGLTYFLDGLAEQ